LRETLVAQGIPVLAEERPFDHGLWLPFKCIWPAAPLPVFQLSLCVREGGPWHLALGEALAPLRDAGVLIVGSGGITHNLGEIHWHAPEGQPASWAVEFMTALEQALEAGDREALCHPWTLPHGRRAHPTLEHYLPFLVALGAAGAQGLAPQHRNWMFGTLALHAYGADALPSVSAASA
jgi:4,5-DOPA dioxygenase extradiol